MKRLILVLCFLLMSCGGGGDDGRSGENLDTADGVVVLPTPTPLPTNQCAHDGDVYLCNGNTCFPDSTSAIVGAVEEPSEEAPTEDEVLAEPEGLAQVTYKSITIGGSVTIIAECGSNVDFNVSETETTMNTSTTTSGTDGGVI